jgi:hypothetical protein
MNVLIAFLFGILTGVMTKPHEQHNSNSTKLANPAQRHGESRPVARAALDSPPSIGDQGSGDEQQSKPQEAVKFWVLQVGGFIVLCAYATFTLIIMLASLRAANAAKEQTELLRQQLIGSQATILELRFDIQNDMANIPSLRAVVGGTGHVTAKSLHASFDVSFKKGHSLENDGPTQHYEIDLPQFTPSQIGNPGTGNYVIKSIGIDGLTPHVWQALQHSTVDKTIMVKGKFRYDNGFGQIMTNDFCYLWLARPTLPMLGSSDAEWIDCAIYPAKVQGWAELEKREHAEQQKKAEQH